MTDQHIMILAAVAGAYFFIPKRAVSASTSRPTSSITGKVDDIQREIESLSRRYPSGWNTPPFNPSISEEDANYYGQPAPNIGNLSRDQVESITSPDGVVLNSAPMLMDVEEYF